MVALKSERRVFLWRVGLVPSPAEALGKVSITLEEVIGLLESMWTAKSARVFLSDTNRILEDDDEAADPKNQLYIADIRRSEDGSFVSILMNRGDPNAVSPSFINTAENDVRRVRPRPAETPGWSAHLLISTNAERGRHRACFEQMPHVSASVVELGLEKMLSRAVERNPTYYFDSIGRKAGRASVERKRYQPVLAVNRVPSENLIDDLDQGQLTGVTLTRERRYYAGPGERDIVKYQEEKVVIHTKPAPKQAVVAALNNLIQQARTDNFQKISFHLEKLPGGATNHPSIDLTTSDAMEALYVRAQRLTDFPVDLEQAYKEVCSEIEQKMSQILVDPKIW